MKLTKSLFEERRNILANIPKFWYIVLAQHEDFQEYVQTEDMKYMEFIKDIFVEKMIDVNGKNDDPKTYAVTFQFRSPDGEIENQKVTKYFYTEVNPASGYESVKSYKAEVKWPAEFEKINPILIKDRVKDGKWTHEEKKNYRIGMKSFFAFFSWTGKHPGKEFRYGEQLAEMLSEDIFPLAVDYYTLAAPGLNENDNEEEEDSSSEELDVESEGDEEEKKRSGDGGPEKKKQKTN